MPDPKCRQGLGFESQTRRFAPAKGEETFVIVLSQMAEAKRLVFLCLLCQFYGITVHP